MAIYAAIEVPLAGFAMANLATMILNSGNDKLAEATETISADVTAEELEMMKKFGLEDGDGNVDKGEFVILCMVRMGAADPDVVKMIVSKFNELDASGDGLLSYNELMGRPTVAEKHASARALRKMSHSKDSNDGADDDVTSSGDIMLKGVTKSTDVV